MCYRSDTASFIEFKKDATLTWIVLFFEWRTKHIMNELYKIAVVIDADNTRPSKIADVLSEISTRGRIVVKRAYGNWRKEGLKNWEPEIKGLAIKAEQQFDYVSGKNATDMALIIDTIELLYTKTYDAFVIVSSDSDYTPLAIKLRESGVYVIGVGEKKTPSPFRNACDEFLFLENISPTVGAQQEDPVLPPPEEEASGDQPTSDSDSAAGEGPAAEDRPDPAAQPAAGSPSSNTNGPAVHDQEAAPDRGGTDETDGIDEIHALLKKASDTYQDDDGYVNLAAAGDFLKRTKPDFDCRTYGQKKLPQLLEMYPTKYEIKRYRGKGTATIVAYKCLE